MPFADPPPEINYDMLTLNSDESVDFNVTLSGFSHYDLHFPPGNYTAVFSYQYYFLAPNREQKYDYRCDKINVDFTIPKRNAE